MLTLDMNFTWLQGYDLLVCTQYLMTQSLWFGENSGISTKSTGFAGMAECFSVATSACPVKPSISHQRSGGGMGTPFETVLNKTY